MQTVRDFFSAAPMARAQRFGFQDLVRRRFRRLFLLVLFLTAITKAGAFLPAYSIDDYFLTLDSPPPATMLGQGRFGAALLLQLFHLIQLEPSYARIFFVAFALAVSSLLAALIVRHWNLKGWPAVAAAAMIALHPFTTEIFTFRTALGISMCALLLLAALLVPRRWSPAGVLAGSALFAVALSIYQVVLHYALMIVLLGAAIGLTRLVIAGRRTALRGMARGRNAALLACTVLGTLLYAAINAVLSRALQVTMTARTRLIPLSGIGERAAKVWEVLRYRFLEPSPLIGRFPKALLLLLLLLALLGLAARLRPLAARSVLLFLAVAGLLAAALVWTVGIILVLDDFWPVPRVMSHTGVFWAGVLAIAFASLGAWGRRALAGVSLLLVLSFVGSSNRILNDQVRLNVRDAAKANRIVARLEALPGFTGTETVAVHGSTWSYPLSYGTADHDMNISAFGADWAKVALLREVSGYDLKLAKADAQKAAAAAYCGGVPPWPGPGSVTIRDGLAILCLGFQP
jgi:hypothetical protein